MKKLVAILAFIGILFQTLSQVVIVAQYYANKDFIAKNLCENRDKPKMHCNGKCCLKKKLAKEGGAQAPTSGNQKSEQVVTLFYSDMRLELKPLIITPAANRYFSANDLRTFSFHGSVFHPPAV